MKNKYSVSIIVPIYNVAKYIERCAVSLFEQDFDNIEYIFVNDCTPDNSIKILESVITSYPDRKPHCKILHHEKNKGLGATRKTGLLQAKGAYILHVDSDDWCELDMVSILYNKAIETNADIVACDYFKNYINKEVCVAQSYATSKEENLAKLLANEVLMSLCNKLIKLDLYTKNGIYPPAEISTAEDRWVLARLFTVSTIISHVPKALFHYYKGNKSSLTSNISPKVWSDLSWYNYTTKEFLKEQGVFDKYRDAFYQGELTQVILCSTHLNYKQNVNYLSPEADKLKYLWRIPQYSLLKKILYTFTLLGLGKLAHCFHFVYLRLKSIVHV